MENIPLHNHDGINSEQIDNRDIIPSPIYKVVPTHNAPEGTEILYWDEGTTYRKYFRINGGWHYANLT